ncbi:MAG: hypothetical protein WBA07_11130 [Rivularia sp. (in: cyanobacteria)]
MCKDIIQIRIENLNEELEKLKIDYQAVYDKKIIENNPEVEHNLERQLRNIFNKMEKIEQEIKDLEEKAKDNKIKELQEILNQFTTKEERSIVNNAYQACSPEGWTHVSTDKPKAILANLMKMRQGDSKYTKVDHFAACLLVLIENQSLITKLKNWAEENINDFDDLFNQEKKALAEKRKENTNSYLLIVLEKSNQDSARNNLDCYGIQAWTINVFDNHSLTRCDLDNQTFTIEKIPDVLKKILNKDIKYNREFFENLTIEIFLPLNLLNHPIDCWGWKYDDGDDDSAKKVIGKKYKVLVRSYERWRKYYKENEYRSSWETKWEKLITSNCDAFFLGSEDAVNDLVEREQEIIGLKVVKAPKEIIGKGSIFAKLIKSTTIPVALWLRKNPPDLECQYEIDQILVNCCIKQLPDAVRKKRMSADPKVETHIGNHISLLWENPYRLPPDITYSM